MNFLSGFGIEERRSKAENSGCDAWGVDNDGVSHGFGVVVTVNLRQSGKDVAGEQAARFSEGEVPSVHDGSDLVHNLAIADGSFTAENLVEEFHGRNVH